MQGGDPSKGAPPPEQVPAPPESDQTQPSRQPDPKARPEGSPKERPSDRHPANRRAYQRETESPEILARAGYKVYRNPQPKPNGKYPDYLIEGKYFDNYAPSTSRARNIWDQIKANKVDSGQADRIILNLEDSVVDLSTLKEQFKNYPMQGLKEVLVIK